MVRFFKKEKTFEIPKPTKKKVISREYKIYKKEEEWSSIPKTFYEVSCHIAKRILRVSPDPITKEKIKRAIDFAHLNVDPEGVASLTLLVAFLISGLTFLLLISYLLFGFGINLGLALLIIFLSIPFAYYLYLYPLHLEKRVKIRIGSDMISMILYMSVYMRETPNMEGAIRFAAENITGRLCYELRKILWDIELGIYKTVDEALEAYMSKWSADRSFIEAIEILKNSLDQPEEQRLRMMDEALELIIDSANETAERYNKELKLPIMLIHAMGILLPVMGLIMFPIIAVFLDVGPIALFIGYDIILPIALLFVMIQVLENRPPTFGRIQVRESEEIPKGKFLLTTYHSKKAVPVLPVSIFLALFVLLIAFLLKPETFTKFSFTFNQSIVFILSGVVFISSYNILNSQQRMKLREKVKSIEEEFTEALFQLGNRLSAGAPIEDAISFLIHQTGDLQIKNMFGKVLKNIKDLGMTFETAVFDPKEGAIKDFPSKLVSSIMKIIIESTKKSSRTAAVGILSISRYMRNIYKTQEHIRSELSDVISSVKFQLFILTPFVSGIIVALTTIIIQILEKIGELSAMFTTAGPVSFFGLIKEIPITIDQFQFIVGVYLLESITLLAMFANGIENGEDPIGRQNLTGYAMLIGFVIYILTMIAGLSIFGPIVRKFMVI